MASDEGSRHFSTILANVRKPAPAWAVSLICAARGGLSWVPAGMWIVRIWI
jgi:hypothetical protein